MDDLQTIINEDRELFFSAIGQKINECKKKLELQPNNISIMRELAKYSSQIGMYQLSDYFLSKAISINPKCLELRVERFHYLLQFGKDKEVYAEIKAMVNKGNLFTYYDANASVILKFINYFSHFFREHKITIELLNKLLNEYPDNEQVLNTLAYAYNMLLGDIKKSRYFIARSIKKSEINSGKITMWLSLYVRTDPKKLLLITKVLKNKYKKYDQLINHFEFNAYSSLGDKIKANKSLDNYKDTDNYLINKIGIEPSYLGSLKLQKLIIKQDELNKYFETYSISQLSLSLAYLSFVISKKYELLNNHREKNINLKKSHNYLVKNKFLSNKNLVCVNEEMPNRIFKIAKKNIKKISKIRHSKLEPIFIVGLPRCGSTILEKLIFENFKVLSCGESEIIRKFILNCMLKKGNPDFLDLYESQFRNIKLYDGFTDKTLNNFPNIELILKSCRNAKFINCIRRPIENILAIYNILFDNIPWAHSLENILEYANQYYILMKKFSKIYPHNILNIYHSELILNKEKELIKISKFLDIKRIKKNSKKKFLGTTTSQWQIREKLSNNFLNKYTNDYYLINKYKNKYPWLE